MPATVENLPAAQFVQLVADARPAVDEYVPTAQFRHTVEIFGILSVIIDLEINLFNRITL